MLPRIAKYLGIYYYCYLLISASWDPVLHCDVFVMNLNFHCIEGFIYTIDSLF